MEALGTLLSEGLNMVIAQLPGMIEAGMQLLGAIGQGLMDNMPVIIDAAMSVVSMLATSVIENLPALASAAIEIIGMLVASIGENLPLILEAGGQMLRELATGIETGLPEMVSRLPQRHRGRKRAGAVIPDERQGPGHATDRQEDVIQTQQDTITAQSEDIQSLVQCTVNLASVVVSVAAISTELPDGLALDMAEAAPDCFPNWEDVLREGAELAQGRVIEKGGQLYRVMQPVMPQAHQEPGGEGMLAVYRPIDREHAGTLEDPIPWVYGMDCLAGLYYSYEGAVYRVAVGGNMIPCVWAPGTPGLWQWELIESA